MKTQKERSKTGCTSCLRRKIKCDEQHPACRQCARAEIDCSWDLRTRKDLQKARRRNKTAYSTVSREPTCVIETHTQKINVADPSQLVSFDNLPGTPSFEENDGVSFTVSHGITRPQDTSHGCYIDSYCPNHDALEILSPFSSYAYLDLLPCANSVRLSHRERLYLEYFPTSSLVKVLGKTYYWSNFRYICEKKASEAIVMYAVMALSASELKPSLDPSDAHDDGQLYYNLALQRIPDAVSSLTCDPNSVEVLLSALFLVIAYEWRFAPSIPPSKACDQGHFTYINGFLQNAIRQLDISNGLTTCPSFTPFCAQVLLWIMYIESSCTHENLSFKVMGHFQKCGEDNKLHALFTFARRSYIFVYGEQYPAEQHEDDLENYSPLELIHHAYLFRYRIWRLVDRYHEGESVQSELEYLWKEINIIRKGFGDLFQLRKTPPNKFRQHRAFITLCEGIASYYCNILFICRSFGDSVVPTESRDQALSELFEICYTIHEWYPTDSTLGFACYLLIAALETKDRIHRDWAYDRLDDLGKGWKTCQWAFNMLRHVHDPACNLGWRDDHNRFSSVI